MKFEKELERDFRRIKKFLRWRIEGQFQLGFSPIEYPNLTTEMAEELYNVDFDN
jgi:hypothetical protein